MIERSIDASEARTIEIAVDGDLNAIGGDGDTINVTSDEDEPEAITTATEGDVVRVRVDGDARLRIPRRLHLRVINASGDVRVAGIGEGAELDNVSGDVRVQEVDGDARVGNVAGDLEVRRVRGSVQCGSVAGDLRIDDVEGDAHGESIAGDASVERVSSGVTLTEPVGGDVSLASIGGAATIASVGGDLSVAGAGSVEAEAIGGDLRLEDVRERVDVKNVGGDAAVDDCRGEVKLGQVGGDLRGRDLAAGLEVQHVGGDLRLRTAFSPGCTYRASCGGSATILILGDPEQVSASFELRADEGRVGIAVPLQDVVREPGLVRGRLGAGQAQVNVRAGERIRLISRESAPGFEGMFDDVFRGLEVGMSEMFGAFEGPGRDRFERRMRDLGDRISRATEEIQRNTAEHVEAQAQRMARRAEELAQRAAERAAQHVARQVERPWRWGGPIPPAASWSRRPPSPPAPPQPSPPMPRASEEERLTVLRMLAEGKINAEQAARLLEALGG